MPARQQVLAGLPPYRRSIRKGWPDRRTKTYRGNIVRHCSASIKSGYAERSQLFTSVYAEIPLTGRKTSMAHNAHATKMENNNADFVYG